MGSPIIGVPSISTMAQAPSTPWRDDEEAEEYARDPKEFMETRCSVFIDNMEIFHNWLVSATYYLPDFEILPGGRKWHRAQTTHDEALWQGKAGLVIAKGPMVFVDEGNVKFHGQKIEVGDWVQYDIHDGRQFTINRIHCRLLKDTQIIARLKDPKLIY